MLESLLISVGALLISLMCFAAATAILVRMIVPWILDDSGFLRGVAVMVTVTLVMVVVHLASISSWATVFLACGELETFEAAFCFSAENYTALGYGNFALSERWRTLGPLEAVNGLLVIGLSTAGMVAVLNQLVAQRIRRQGLRWPAEQLSREPGHTR